MQDPFRIVPDTFIRDRYQYNQELFTVLSNKPGSYREDHCLNPFSSLFSIDIFYLSLHPKFFSLPDVIIEILD